MVILFSIVAVGYAAKKLHVMPVAGDAFNALGAMTTPAALLVVGSSLADMPASELVGGPRLWVSALVKTAL